MSRIGLGVLLASWEGEPNWARGAVSFNARLHRRFPREERIIGDHVFGNPEAESNPAANRALLVDLCISQKLLVGNTFFEKPPEQQITCYNVGAERYSPADPKNFGQIYFALISQAWSHKLLDVTSDRTRALASHHFILHASLDLQVDKQRKRQKQPRMNFAALREESIAESFRETFHSEMASFGFAEDLNAYSNNVGMAMRAAATSTIPTIPLQPHKPWIAARTLDLIQRRNSMSSSGDSDGVERLSKDIKKSVGQDRSDWLDALLDSGDWQQIRELRRGYKPKQGRLRDSVGILISSESRAETLAEYYSTIQWAVRPVQLMDSLAPLGSPLQIASDGITEQEVISAAKKLRWNKACGHDELPP